MTRALSGCPLKLPHCQLTFRKTSNNILQIICNIYRLIRIYRIYLISWNLYSLNYGTGGTGQYEKSLSNDINRFYRINKFFSQPCPGFVLLPKTGQTLFFYPGDDGDLRKGVDWPEPRFETNGDCILDKLTGLEWARTPSSNTMTWYQALDYSKSQSICEKNDWRLPNARELLSLVNYQEAR